MLAKFDNYDLKHIISTFDKLRQCGSVSEYVETFPKRASLLEFNPLYNEQHFMHSFISSLNKEIRHAILILKPQSLEEAISLAEHEDK